MQIGFSSVPYSSIRPDYAYKALASLVGEAGIAEKYYIKIDGHPEKEISGTVVSAKNESDNRLKKLLGLTECQTCLNRTYQDQSDDPGVSFKAPGYIAPETSASTVMAHEREHIVRERYKAGEQKREVISQQVQLFTNVCPECGKVYVSVGKATTVTASRDQPFKNMLDNYHKTMQGNQTAYGGRVNLVV